RNGGPSCPVAGTSKPLKGGRLERPCRPPRPRIHELIPRAALSDQWPPCKPGRSSMTPLRYFAAVALIVAANSLAGSSAFAADPVFPPGARVGMTPLVGLNKART